MKKVILNETYAQCIIQKMVLSLALVLYASLMQAQVNVGLNEDALSGAIMQWKQIPNVTNGGANATGGLAFPRVALTDVNQLSPIALGASETNAQYTGLVVYNVGTTGGVTPGLNQWDGTKWVPLVQTQAVFSTVSCSSIVVNGTYGVGTPVNGQNYITLNLTVQQTGAFSIAVTSGNGYSFYLSGMALETGPLTLNLPAQGVPITSQQDNLTFTGVTLASGCNPIINVQPQALFDIDCSSTVALGTYSKGVALVPSVNQLAVHVTPTQTGAWYMNTETENGMTFSGSGNFTTLNAQVVYLSGTGTPLTNTTANFTLYAMGGATSCNPSVNVTPTVTYAIISDGSTWSYGTTMRMGALASPVNFGPSGTVRLGQFNLLWTANANNILTGQANGSSTASIITTATSAPGSSLCPDIIIYFSYAAYPTQALMTALANYVNAGGCLIFAAALDQGAATAEGLINPFLSSLFSSSPTVTAQIAGSPVTISDIYTINSISDPIINGPFGNLAGSHWGEDGTSTLSAVVTSIPTSSVQICSAQTSSKSQPATTAIVWYDTIKNFVFFGDSGGSDYSTNTSLTSDPAVFTASPNFLPVQKQYGTSNSVNVANSQLEMNVVAWLIGRAISNGINPH